MIATDPQHPSGDLKIALQHAAGLLRQDPKLAAQQAKEILKVYPNIEPAERILGAAYRLQGQPKKGVAWLEPLAKKNANSVEFLHELGRCLGAAGRGDDAIECLREAVRLSPKHAGAWQTLGDQLNAAGDEDGSRKAYDKHLQVSTRHPELVEAANFLYEKKLAKAERLTRDVLKKDPADVIAIRMLAEIGVNVGQFEDAQNLLERCLELAPDFHHARHAYANVLMRRNDLEASLREADRLLLRQPKNPAYLLLKGAVLARKGDHPPALQIYEQVLENYPRQASAHMFYGHTLKTVGKLDDAISAYRKSIELSPSIGEAYWSLANLKTFRFTDEDIANMRE